jgi:hypothetical protein
LAPQKSDKWFVLVFGFVIFSHEFFVVISLSLFRISRCVFRHSLLIFVCHCMTHFEFLSFVVFVFVFVLFVVCICIVFVLFVSCFVVVVVLCGAGISTSCGIPDFRSAETGLYNNEETKQMFDLTTFDTDPSVMYKGCQKVTKKKKKKKKKLNFVFSVVWNCVKCDSFSSAQVNETFLFVQTLFVLFVFSFVCVVILFVFL